MEETRRYFDYELAYEGYEKAKELLDKNGIQGLIDSDEFKISDNGTIEDWAYNGYVPFYASGYNATIYVIDSNFDTDNKENNWYASGEVDIHSYSGGDDNLYINSKIVIQERLNSLLDYAKKNNYSLEDIYAEYESLKSVLEELE